MGVLNEKLVSPLLAQIFYLWAATWKNVKETVADPVAENIHNSTQSEDNKIFIDKKKSQQT